ncbi:MAG: hypothetical protein HC880_02135 [Bacteroidia bacterium]|nr:hypothetical protein [Bacteroidia bacterium]
MHKIINSIILFALAVFNRIILAPLRARQAFQPIFKKMIMMGAYGMNYGRHGGVEISGEAAALNYVKSRLNFSENGMIFDVGGAYRRILPIAD